jgi:hypothetical protein
MCKDPALLRLAQYGYNAIRLPRENIRPLDVLMNAKTIERLGPISDFCEAGTATPIPTRSAAAPLDGVSSNALNLGAGLEVLAGFLGLTSSSSAGFGVAYKGASRLRFHFDAPSVDGIDPSALDKWLRKTRLVQQSMLVDILRKSKPPAALVITEILTSREFSVEALEKDGGSSEASIPAIEQVLGASAKFSVDRRREGQLTYSGKRHLAFGFKAFELGFDSGHFALKSMAAGDIFLGPIDPVEGDASNEKPFVFDDPWVTIKEPRSS